MERFAAFHGRIAVEDALADSGVSMHRHKIGSGVYIKKSAAGWVVLPYTDEPRGMVSMVTPEDADRVLVAMGEVNGGKA